MAVTGTCGKREPIAGYPAPHDPAMDCRIVLVSDAYTFFTVTGNKQMKSLAIASPLDIRLINFPENAATYSELFGIRKSHNAPPKRLSHRR